MQSDGKRIMRKCAALVIAVLCFYIIHEGAHLLYALSAGAFKQINFMQFGVQIDTYAGVMTTTQIGIFCIVGPFASLAAAYLMLLLTKRFIRNKSVFFRATTYYITLALLLTDPIYLSLVYPYVGGGDMNGISLLLPELAARIGFGVLLLVNLVVIVVYLVPVYQKAYQEHSL